MNADEHVENSDYSHMSKSELCDRLNTLKDALVRQNEENSRLKLDNGQLRHKADHDDQGNDKELADAGSAVSNL
jgi:regulator of replication initiation timing